MEPHIIQAAEKLMTRPGILGVIICRRETVYFYKTDPRFSYTQIQNFGHAIHGLFSGYMNVQRHISEVSLLFNEACLSVTMLKEKQTLLYLATLAENLEALSLATEETRQWGMEDLVKKSKRTSKITSKLRPTAHLMWGRFLSRIRECLDRSLGNESASIVLTRALESFSVNSSDPLPEEQWQAFAEEVAHQIPNPDARVRFYNLYSASEPATAR